MLTKELKKDFYVKLQNKRVIVLASYEVDSVAACRILINLFKTDSIQYTLVPVFTSDNIEQAFLEHNAHCNDFLFINCGATIDLLELLSPGGMINFYIIDAHRPISVTNVFSEQIHVLIRDSEPIEEIPKFDDVFRDDDEDDDEGIEEDPNAEDGESSENEGEGDENRDPESATDPSTGFSRRRKKKGFDDEKYLRLAKKQRERRQWEDKRTQILRTYEESTFFSCSSAEICYELSWLLSKDTNNLLWLAIIGLTDQYFLNRVSKSGTNYLNERDFLGSHVRRLNNWLENDSSSIVSVDCMKISSEKELRIYLYRHWTIWESFYNSLFTMSQFKLWSLKGQRKHLDFLSSIGLSLQNCKRKFKCIDTKVRTECSSKIISTYERLFRQGLKSNIWFSSFTAQYGVMNKFSALDVTIAMNALLEDPATVASSTEKFMRALDALSYTNCQMVADSIDKAKFLLQAVCEQVNLFQRVALTKYYWFQIVCMV